MHTPSTLCRAREHRGAVGLGIHRPPCPFQAAHGGVAIHTQQKGVAKITRVLQVRHVAEMQDVKAAVRDDQLSARRAKFLSPRRQIVPGDDFVAEMHLPILPTPERMATILPRRELVCSFDIMNTFWDFVFVPKEQSKIARHFNAGNLVTTAQVPEGRAGNRRGVFRSSPRDLMLRQLQPGIEMPGYFQLVPNGTALGAGSNPQFQRLFGIGDGLCLRVPGGRAPR